MKLLGKKIPNKGDVICVIDDYFKMVGRVIDPIDIGNCKASELHGKAFLVSTNDHFGENTQITTYRRTKPNSILFSRLFLENF